ncbi:BLUF domain-containing protein [Spongiibacter sp. KMU-158]|uniref:BLUF domain-containing protein n=1 Tax=Spongiibacter pelagi TaxID=2760804 RepID=A0A927C0Y4_9GAMM|nr:BLUF domain-containing protein [Spongiibacter pelagi]MBD2857530.1 BLUF domain-containing protein [Spongiibacter pelagi]
MKRVVCLGTMLLPPGSGSAVPSNFIISLYTEIRNFADKKSVSGTFAVADKIFMLQLEGDNKKIAGLIRHLNMDSRMIDVSVVANYSVDDRTLPEWKIRVVKTGSADRNNLLGKLRDMLQGHIQLHKPADGHRLQRFFQAAGYPVPGAEPVSTISPA